MFYIATLNPRKSTSTTHKKWIISHGASYKEGLHIMAVCNPGGSDLFKL